jgi:hypothetical protein
MLVQVVYYSKDIHGLQLDPYEKVTKTGRRIPSILNSCRIVAESLQLVIVVDVS